jgi:hypothetical protein
MWPLISEKSVSYSRGSRSIFEPLEAPEKCLHLLNEEPGALQPQLKNARGPTDEIKASMRLCLSTQAAECIHQSRKPESLRLTDRTEGRGSLQPLVSTQAAPETPNRSRQLGRLRSMERMTPLGFLQEANLPSVARILLSATPKQIKHDKFRAVVKIFLSRMS